VEWAGFAIPDSVVPLIWKRRTASKPAIANSTSTIPCHERRLIALRRERVQFRHFQERLDDQYPNSPTSPAAVPMRLSTTAAA
jgi:hypothetical protein